jgi:regulator of replication initiation timing
VKLKLKFTTLLFIVGIIGVVLSATGSVIFYKQKTEETRKIALLEKQIEAVKIEKISVLNKIKEVNEYRKRLQVELESCNQKAIAVQSDININTQVINEISAKLSEKESVISGLRSQLGSIIEEEARLNAELENARSEYQLLRQRTEATQNEKSALEEAVKGKMSTPQGVELKKIVVKVNPPKEGKVIEVNKDYNFSVINLGLKDSIKSGDVVAVYRNDQFIAKAVVENIYDEMSSIILFDEWSNVQLVENDIVKVLTP